MSTITSALPASTSAFGGREVEMHPTSFLTTHDTDLQVFDMFGDLPMEGGPWHLPQSPPPSWKERFQARSKIPGVLVTYAKHASEVLPSPYPAPLHSNSNHPMLQPRSQLFKNYDPATRMLVFHSTDFASRMRHWAPENWQLMLSNLIFKWD